MTLREIANKIQGNVVGNELKVILFPAKIEDAGAENISFIANEKYLPFLKNTKAGAIVISKALFEKIKNDQPMNWIIVEDAYVAFSKVLALFQLTPTASVQSPLFKIGENTIVYPHVFIGDNVQIGDHCIIYPNVTIYRDCVIGNNCISG